MADPKAPELAEAFIDDLAFLLRLPVAEIRRPVMALLKARSLHIVSEADRKVLEACAAFPTAALKHDAYTNRNELSDLSLRWTEAELARRSGT